MVMRLRIYLITFLFVVLHENTQIICTTTTKMSKSSSSANAMDISTTPTSTITLDSASTTTTETMSTTTDFTTDTQSTTTKITTDSTSYSPKVSTTDISSDTPSSTTEHTTYSTSYSPTVSTTDISSDTPSTTTENVTDSTLYTSTVLTTEISSDTPSMTTENTTDSTSYSPTVSTTDIASNTLSTTTKSTTDSTLYTSTVSTSDISSDTPSTTTANTTDLTSYSQTVPTTEITTDTPSTTTEITTDSTSYSPTVLTTDISSDTPSTTIENTKDSTSYSTTVSTTDISSDTPSTTTENTTDSTSYSHTVSTTDISSDTPSTTTENTTESTSYIPTVSTTDISSNTPSTTTENTTDSTSYSPTVSTTDIASNTPSTTTENTTDSTSYSPTVSTTDILSDTPSTTTESTTDSTSYSTAVSTTNISSDTPSTTTENTTDSTLYTSTVSTTYISSETPSTTTENTTDSTSYSPTVSTSDISSDTPSTKTESTTDSTSYSTTVSTTDISSDTPSTTTENTTDSTSYSSTVSTTDISSNTPSTTTEITTDSTSYSTTVSTTDTLSNTPSTTTEIITDSTSYSPTSSIADITTDTPSTTTYITTYSTSSSPTVSTTDIRTDDTTTFKILTTTTIFTSYTYSTTVRPPTTTTAKVIDCGRVPNISNAVINSINTTYGSLANVTCNIGYNASKPVIQCTASGTWENSTCTVIDCGRVPNISNGVINSINTTYGSLANVTCNIGYNASKPVIQCTASRTWENSTCTVIDCGQVPTISNGVINAINTKYGSLANVTCNTGYNASKPVIHCTASGTWENSTCTIKDCGRVLNISNGVTNSTNTTYGSLANIICNTGYNTSKPVIQCTAAGIWENSTCTIIDCGKTTPAPPTNGTLVEPPVTTTYGSRAVYSCNDGYSSVGNAISTCLANGSWSSLALTCQIRDCGKVLGIIANGNINYTSNKTTYGSIVNFECDKDYTLIGVNSIICNKLGQWSGLTPTCHRNRPRTCTAETDIRGTVWTETSINSTALQSCADGFDGMIICNITRRCSVDGVWQLPHYNCVRKSVQAVNDKVGNLSKNATEDDLKDALSAITSETTRSQNSTDDQKLTDGELSLLTSALDTVAGVLSSSSVKITDNISNSFIDSASNLIDGTNKESWKALSSTNNGAEKVLSAVDSLGEALAKSLEGGEDKKTVVKKNIALEVKKIFNNTVVFPVRSTNTSDTEDTQWITESRSQVQLDPIALKDSVNFLATAVMYRDMSDILSSKRSSGNGSEEEHEQRINGPILALSISPEFNKTLDPPVTIKFEHQLQNYSAPQCSYWSFQNNSHGFWSSEGCKVNSTNGSMTVCTCDHLTNFAVLMSPFRQDNTTPKALRIISIVGICLSIVCLITTFVVHFVLWKYLRNDRTTVLMNLCVALLLSYIIFLTGIDRTESNIACTIIAAILHYIYLVVFCVMLVEGILIASMVLFVFDTKYRVKMLLGIAWALPAVIVGISLGASKTLGYGNDSVCWLSTDNGLIWAFVGPALLIITFNVVCLLVVIRALFRTKAMLSKTTFEKAKTSLRSLAVLVPLMGISWIVGIFYVDESVDFIQYIFAILNGLQGVFIFMLHCLLNDHVKKGIRLWQRKKSWSWAKSTSGNTSNKYKDSNELRETDKSHFNSSGDKSRSYNDWREKALEYSFPKSVQRTKHSPAQLSNPTYKYIGEERSKSTPQYTQV